MSRRHAFRKLKRDTILFGFGLAGITYQTVTDRVNIALLVVFGLAAGIPGVSSLWQLRPSTDESTTPSSPSPSPSSPSPSSLES